MIAAGSSSAKGRILVVGGSDSSGGAGIQADIKTIMALGGYATTAITALTVQNTLEVQDVLPVFPDFVAAQMTAALDDIGADCIKIGMLNTTDIIDAVCDVLDRYDHIPVVLDPVMVSSSGDCLLDKDAEVTLKEKLLPRAELVTPNIPEVKVLVGANVESFADMTMAALSLYSLGAKGVLIKGGHLPGSTITDLLLCEQGQFNFDTVRIETRHTHGTGCTLASAIATGIAQGMPMRTAVERARHYLERAIRSAPGLGLGNGPLGHGHTLKS